MDLETNQTPSTWKAPSTMCGCILNSSQRLAAMVGGQLWKEKRWRNGGGAVPGPRPPVPTGHKSPGSAQALGHSGCALPRCQGPVALWLCCGQEDRLSLWHPPPTGPGPPRRHPSGQAKLREALASGAGGSHQACGRGRMCWRAGRGGAETEPQGCSHVVGEERLGVTDWDPGLKKAPQKTGETGSHRHARKTT